MGYEIFERMIENNQCGINKTAVMSDVDKAALAISNYNIAFIWNDPRIKENSQNILLLASIGEYSYREAHKTKDMLQMPGFAIRDIEDFLYSNYFLNSSELIFEYAIRTLKLLKIIEDHGNNGNTYRLSFPLFSIFAHNNNMLENVLLRLEDNMKTS